MQITNTVLHVQNYSFTMFWCKHLHQLQNFHHSKMLRLKFAFQLRLIKRCNAVKWKYSDFNVYDCAALLLALRCAQSVWNSRQGDKLLVALCYRLLVALVYSAWLKLSFCSLFRTCAKCFYKKIKVWVCRSNILRRFRPRWPERRADMKSSKTWGVVNFLGGIVLFIIYFFGCLCTPSNSVIARIPPDKGWWISYHGGATFIS